MSFFAAAGITLAARLVVDLLRDLADSARPGAAADIVTFAASFAIAHLFFIFVIVRIWSPDASLRAVLGLRRPPISTTALAAIGGAAMYPPLARLDSSIGQRFPLSPEEQALAERLGDTTGLVNRVGLAVTFLLVLPILSEMFFRGAIYGRLRRERSEGLAVFATTAFFVLSSFDPRTMASTLGLGAALTYLRARTGSCIPSMCAHVGFFATMVAPMFATGELKDDATWSMRWVVGGAAVSLASLAAALASATASDACRIARAQDA